MSKNKDLSQTISYKGTFDVSGIIRGLQEVRNQMGKMTTDVSGFKKVDEQLEKIRNLTKTMQTAVAKGFSNPKELEDFNRMTENLKKSFEKILVDFSKLDDNLSTNSIKTLKENLDAAKRSVDSIQSSFSTIVKSTFVSNTKDFAQQILKGVKAGEKLEDIQERIVSHLKNQVTEQKKIATSAQNEVNKKREEENLIRNTVPRVGLQSKSFQTIKKTTKKGTTGGENITAEQWDSVSQIFNQALIGMVPKVNTSKTNLDAKINSTITNIKKQLKNLGLEMKNETTIANKLREGYNQLSDKIQDAAIKTRSAQNISEQQQRALASREQVLQQVTTNFTNEQLLSLYKELIDKQNKLTQAQKDYNNVSKTNNPNLKSLKQINSLLEQQFGQIKQNTQATRESIKTQVQYDNTFDNLRRYIQYTFSLTNGFRVLRRVISQTLTDIKNLDKSFADIAMVTDYSVAEMWKSYDQYAIMANELGQSTQDVIKASGLFYQQGLDTTESLELTTETMKLATLAGIDFEEATSQMTAAIRGFNLKMDEGQRVTDVYSELAAKAAADVEGIAYAMSKTASIANSAGMSFENTAAFLTQMIETTQEAPENIGTAMKTIIARFTELKENVAGTSESEFEDLDYNKVDIALKSVGVSIKDATGQFRNLDEVFLELSEKWSSLDRNTQRYIATIAAGSRQQSRFIAMMENYDRTLELTETAYNSAGKASEQFAKYQDTVEYKTKQLTNTWEQLRTKFLDSSTYKGILDFLNNLMNTIGDMDLSQFIALGVIGLTVGKSVVSNFVTSLQTGLSNTTRAWETGINAAISKIQLNRLMLPKAKEIVKSFETTTNQNTVRSAQNAKWLSEYVQISMQLKNIAIEMEKINQKGDEINADDQERLNILRQQNRELIKQAQSTRKNLITRGGLTRTQVQQGASDLKGQTGSMNTDRMTAITGVGTQAISAGITTALMMAISGADFETVIKTAGISALASTIPVLINAAAQFVLPKLIAMITTLGGAFVTAGVVALAVGIKVAHDIEKANAATEKAELNRLKNVEKENEKLQKKQISALQKANSAKKQQKEVQELVDRYNQLSNKSFLTEKESTELSDVKNKINSDYSELVLNYNEQTEALRLNTLALENLTKQYQEDEKTAMEEARFAQVSLITNTNEAQKIAEKIADKYSSYLELEGWENRTFVGYSSNLTRVVSKEPPKLGAGGTKYETLTDFNFKQLKRDLEEGFGAGSDLYNSLGLKGADLDNYQTFNDYLEQTGYTLQEFIKVVSDAANTRAEELKGETLIQARQGAENVYMSYNIEEDVMSEEMARSLSYSVTEEDLEFDGLNMSDFEEKISKGIEDNKNFLRDYLQAIQEGETASESGGVSEALRTTKVTTDKTADDIIREKIKQWKDNEEELMEGTDGNLNIWADLPKEMQNYLTTAGYTEKNWDDIKDDAEASKKAIDGFFYNLLLKEQEAFGTLTEEQISNNEPELAKINELLTNIGSFTQDEFLNQLTQTVTGMSDDVRDAFLAGQGLKWDANNKRIIEAEESVKDSAVYAFIEATKSFKTLKITGVEGLNLSIQQSILDTIKKANLDTKTAGQFGQDLVSFLNNNIDSESQNILASIDLTQSYSELLTNSQSYIEQLQKSGYSSEQASKIFNDYILKARDYIFSAISSLEGITVLRESINTNLSGMSEKYGTLLEAQKEYQEEGALSSETYYKLLEEGFDEYVKITGKGYELLGEKASEAYNQEALNQYSTYLASIEDQQRTINVLTTNKEIQKQYLDENGNTINAGSYSLKELANYYKINSEELEKYTGKYKNLIQDFVNSGDNWEDYIQNLKDVKQEMEDQKSEVYIQSLHTITDAYDEVKEEIEDLNSELEDLNEQLEEDKKAMDEAYQALQDAIHGSEDYQSSLDGLFNYEKRLDSLNDKLEETKEALSDISSIEEAKDLLQNTQSLYENKLGTLQAQNKVIDQSIKNLDEEILKNYGDFVGFDEFSNMTVDIKKLEDADMSDILKDDGFTQLIEKRVEMKDKLDEGNKEILETEKAWNEQLKEAREGQIAIEEKVINILKEKMQEEIDATNEKYAALEEADNNYLDALQEAIDKQRELREQENQYEDLATKQKKLSLMQRDTSGANQKEVQSLEKEIDEDRQGLLDSEVDNLIESMRELYEKQQEARELEIEAMEAATENMQVINETALNIISGFQTAEDYQAWLIENNTSVEDMTVTQTEAYLDEAKETFSSYAQYVALTAEDMALRTDEINANADMVFENTSENVTTIGTTIQDLAEAASQKAIDEAQDAYDDATKKWNETQDKIAETTNKLNAAEANAISTHQSTMNALVDASQSGMADVAEFAVSELAALTGLDLGGDSKKVKEFLEEHNLITEDGGISQGVYNAITAAGGDTSGYTVSNARYSLKAVSSSGLSTIGQFATQEAAEAEKQRRIAEGSTSQYVIDKTDLDGKPVFDKHGIKWPDGTVNNYSTEDDANKDIERIKKSNDQTSENKQKKTWIEQGKYEIFKTGGLVNYTGPAWVDGTPSKPEAFLSAQDTERIGNAAKLLADLPILNSTSNANNAVSSNIGDTSIEIHINVESLASDYDVDQMIERVKNDILDVSKPTGTSVILHK